MPDRFTSIVDAHVLLRRDGELLLLRRAGNVYASGQLCLPSGHLEEGQSIVDAAVAETKQEVGIVLDPTRLTMVLAMHQRNMDGINTRFGFFFQPEHWDGQPANCEPHKHSELIWADPDKLPPDTHEYTAAAIAAIQRGSTFTLNGWR